jgi:hypothetical protein
MLRSVESNQTFTRYRTRINWWHHGGYSSCLHTLHIKSSTVVKEVQLCVPHADAESIEIPRSGFLVFEVIDEVAIQHPMLAIQHP